MWCHRCKLDVPARQQPPETVLRCGVCAAVLPGAAPPGDFDSISHSDEGEPLGPPHVRGAEDAAEQAPRPHCTASFADQKGDTIRPDAASSPAFPNLNDESWDEELAEVRLLIRRTSHLIVSPWEADDAFSLADCLEPGRNLATAPETEEGESTSAPPSAEPGHADQAAVPSGRWWEAGGWFLICLGAMGLMFASVLFTATQLGVPHGRAVWPLCLISAFAGQFLVVLGFLLRHGSARDWSATPARGAESMAPPPIQKVSASQTPAQAGAVAKPQPDKVQEIACEPRLRAMHRPPWSETVERALAPLVGRD